MSEVIVAVEPSLKMHFQGRVTLSQRHLPIKMSSIAGAGDATIFERSKWDAPTLVLLISSYPISSLFRPPSNPYLLNSFSQTHSLSLSSSRWNKTLFFH